MKRFFAIAILATSVTGIAAFSHPAEAGYQNSYAYQYCQFYKTRAMHTGDPAWWSAYYQCLADQR